MIGSRPVVEACAEIRAGAVALQARAYEPDSIRLNPRTYRDMGEPSIIFGLRVFPDASVPAATFVLCMAPKALPTMSDGAR